MQECPKYKFSVTKKCILLSHTMQSYYEIARLQPNGSCTSSSARLQRSSLSMDAAPCSLDLEFGLQVKTVTTDISFEFYILPLAEIRCLWNWGTYQLHLTHHDRNLKDIQKSERQNKALQSLSFVQLLLVLRQLLLHALPLFSQPQAAFACWLLPIWCSHHSSMVHVDL